MREQAYEEGRAGFHLLAVDPTFRDFVCMYMSEGYKRSRNTVAICNSDPRVVQLGATWITRLTRSKWATRSSTTPISRSTTWSSSGQRCLDHCGQDQAGKEVEQQWAERPGLALGTTAF
jgi:hypothetical protein